MFGGMISGTVLAVIFVGGVQYVYNAVGLSECSLCSRSGVCDMVGRVGDAPQDREARVREINRFVRWHRIEVGLCFA